MEALSTIRTSLARWKPLDSNLSAQVLPLGIPALDAALPGGGLALGGVTELQIRGASGIATSFALAACRAAQQLGREQGRKQGSATSQGSPLYASASTSAARTSTASSSQRSAQQDNGVWCAFIDPSASLFAPGVTRLGVDLSHLLVTRPSVDAIERVAVRIAETNLMAVLVIDLGCLMLPSSNSMQANSMQASSLNEHSWQRTVRRLSLAIKSSLSSVLLITQAEQFQSLPLPASQRLELTRRSQTSFELVVAKSRTGHIAPARLLPCSLFDLNHFDRSGFASHGFASHGFASHGFASHGFASHGFASHGMVERHWGSELTVLSRKVS